MGLAKFKGAFGIRELIITRGKIILFMITSF